MATVFCITCTDVLCGFAGRGQGGDIIDSYWDTEATTQSDEVGYSYASTSNSHGLTTSEMTGENAKSNMTAFDFTGLWNTTDTYPDHE